MICEQCGGDRVFSYPPPANGCPVCGAPVCCRTCCDARSPGYNREDDLPESPSSPAIPKMQAFAPMEEMARLRREHAAMEKARDQAVDIALKTQFALASAESDKNLLTALLADASAQLCAANERLREYETHGTVGYWHFDLPGGFTKHNVLGARELIIRPARWSKQEGV